jgi:L-aminopeptidase/D-esterase-like protein
VELGILPPGLPNAITDVAGVRVGHVTLVESMEVPELAISNNRCAVTTTRGHQARIVVALPLDQITALAGAGKTRPGRPT